MNRYRDKATGREVQAVRLTSENGRQVWAWAPGKQYYAPGMIPDGLTIFTPEGRAKADFGDWVVCNAAGEFRVSKADRFPTQYTAVDADAAFDLPTAERGSE